MKTRGIILIILAGLVGVFGLLGWRLFYLQHSRIEYYRDSSNRQQYAVVSITPRRGQILDRQGRVLAASNRVKTVFVEPRAIASIDDVKEIASGLQPIVNIPGNKICGMILDSRNPGFAPILTGVTPAQSKAIADAGLVGVGIQSNWQRYYPMGPLTSHIVGLAGVDQSGLEGIELKYDSKLTPSKGRNVFFVDALRRPIGMKDSDSAGADGSNLVLTIDSTIQQFVREALLKQFKAYQAESATAIVMDPWTGAILAMVSLPDYDPDDCSKTDPENMRNRAVSDTFEPGSIFKPIVAAIALDEAVLTRTEKIFCENGYYAKFRIGEWANHSYGDMTVGQILIESSNIGMAKIGQKLGPKRLHDGVKLFGFGAKTAVDLPGETRGVLHPPDKWSSYSVTRIPYGHEITVTAVQIIRAFAILANGGSPVRPHVLRAVIAPSGEIEELYEPSGLAGFVVSTEVANWIVREALTGVVKEGTGTAAAIDGCDVFGKTGTANIALASGKGYDTTNYTASFVGGAPAQNPAVVILVSIRKPNKALDKGYSGGRVAAPVFREILKKTLACIENK